MALMEPTSLNGGEGLAGELAREVGGGEDGGGGGGRRREDERIYSCFYRAPKTALENVYVIFGL